MAATSWWVHATPHPDIQEGRVNETLFAANLGKAIQSEGPREYCDAEIFFTKTYLTRGLRELLIDALHVLSGQSGKNAVANLQTSFGGGKTHAELAIYHLLKHPTEALRVLQVRSLLAEAGVGTPPACQVAVLSGSSLNPLGRTTVDGLTIRTLWGEMAYQLGGKPAFDLVAPNDRQLVAPGEETLEQLLELVGPSIILFDETLHYVDKVSEISGTEGDLAKQTVAFLRELTVAVDTVPRRMLVASLTASRMDQLSNHALDWLERMNKHVSRIASSRTPIEGTEIHGIVRQRLFEHVDEDVARQIGERYHQLYVTQGGLPAQAQGMAYQELIARSFPFHPELVTVLYERWGSKPSFQLTRGSLRFLALVLQDLWRRREEAAPDLIQFGDISLSESNVRAVVREVAGDPQWESVIGSDIAAAPGTQLAKAQIIDQERNDGLHLAEKLAGTILFYSLGGGENPLAARHELRLACSRPAINEATWDDVLDRFRNRLFYFYFEDQKYRFRKEPNVLSLQHTYRTNLKDSDEVRAYIVKTVPDKTVGSTSPVHGFTRVYIQPGDSADIPDGDELKLVVLGFEHVMSGEHLTDLARQAILEILQRRGQVLRQHRNTLVFCLADVSAALQAGNVVCDYLSWRKIQRNATDWDRIGGPQQAIVKDQLGETEGTAQQALISAYSWALVPAEDAKSGQLTLRPVRLGAYGPGKLVAPMVWERLIAENGHGHAILTSLTPDTMLERYGRRSWPEVEAWVTTIQLWQRFTRQVGLPILARQQVLLETLQLGQREGFFALGHLADEKSPRDQRDSYLSLFFKDVALPSNVPGIGERWLVLRPNMYEQIVDQPAQVTTLEVAQAIRDLSGDGQPVAVSTLYKYVKAQKRDNIQNDSFRIALATALHDKIAVYRLEQQGTDVADIPADVVEVQRGFVSTKTKEEPQLVATGRTIILKGLLASLNELAPLYRNVLQPFASQKPKNFTIELNITVQFEMDPGAAFDALLEEGFNAKVFPGLTLSDSKKAPH